jgi:hypothetical protein
LYLYILNLMYFIMKDFRFPEDPPEEGDPPPKKR